MKILGLKSIIRVKKYKSTRESKGKLPNVLQNFKSDTPNLQMGNQMLQSLIPLSGNKLYLSPIIDLFNGEIVSF